MAELKTDSCLIFICLICCFVGSKSCGETQCQVFVEGEDPTTQFRSMANEEGVRLVYLKFTIYNNSYRPLISQDRILPYRWTWAQSVSEAMLSLSYDYDVLSLGLLNNQARSMVVVLKELQSGCLQGLNSSCQDITIAKGLLDMTRDRDSTPPPRKRNDVVCVRVLKEYSFGVGGGFKYQCCGEDRLSNKSKIYCGQNVKESEWLAVFNAILALVVSVVFLYWPIIICALPDAFFDEDHDRVERTSSDEESIRARKSHEIPVDDLSPITVAMICRTLVENMPTLNHSFNLKVFLLWYCLIPICFYIKVILYFIIKSSFDDASRKLIFQFGDFYIYVFSMNRPLVYVFFILPLFVIPGVIFSFWTEENLIIQTKCCLCKRNGITPRKEILKHVQLMPDKIFNATSYFTEAFLTCFRCKSHRNRTTHDHHSMCGYSICVLWSVASVVIMGPIFAITTIVIYIIASICCIILFSPYICFIMRAFRFIRGKKAGFWLIFLAVLYSTLSVGIVLIFSCQFVVRMFGFIIMGITLNAEFVVPYITFVFVVWRNISLCYGNLQNRYKEIKEMISEQWKEQRGEHDTISIKLFWYVCNKHNILPVTNEICFMLRNIVFIVIFLIVALSAILLFKVTYNLSAVVSSIAVFLSGKISEMFFTGVTTGYSFSGWEKIDKVNLIGDAVQEFIDHEEETLNMLKTPHECQLTSAV